MSLPVDEGPVAREVRVLVVDDDPTTRRALREALEDATSMTMAAELSSGAGVVSAVSRFQPDVIVIDADMPDVDGVTATLRLHQAFRDIGVLVLTTEDSDELGLLALHAGAVGFLSKDVPLDAIVRATRGIGRGEAAISRHLTRRAIEELRRLTRAAGRMRPVESRLTPREWQVLGLLAEGCSTPEMAERLVVSVDTVRSHVKHVLAKLDAHSREEAVAKAEWLRGLAAGRDDPGGPAFDETTLRRHFQRMRGGRGGDVSRGSGS